MCYRGKIGNFIGIHKEFEKEDTSNINIKDFDIEKNVNNILKCI